MAEVGALLDVIDEALRLAEQTVAEPDILDEVAAIVEALPEDGIGILPTAEDPREIAMSTLHYGRLMPAARGVGYLAVIDASRIQVPRSRRRIQV